MRRQFSMPINASSRHSMTGILPAVALDWKTRVAHDRTGVYEYLPLLFGSFLTRSVSSNSCSTSDFARVEIAILRAGSS